MNKKLKIFTESAIGGLDRLLQAVETDSSSDLTVSVGDCKISGLPYQVQLTITPNPAMWVENDEIAACRYQFNSSQIVN